VEETELTAWLVEQAEQAQWISREMQPVLDAARSAAPLIRQVNETAAVMRPVLDAVGLVRRQTSGMADLLNAVREYANTPLALQMRVETNEVVAKLLIDVQIEEAESAAGLVLEDPGAAVVVEQATTQLEAAGAAKLPPTQLLVVILIWLLCVAATAAPELPHVPTKIDLPIGLAPAYVGLALALQWRIQDRRKR
jgi:hypothetical protein